MKFFKTIVLLFTLLISTNVFAKEPFHWDFINVEINLQDNGDLLIQETQRYVFDEPHSEQRFRWIKLGGIDDITDISVTDDGKPLPIQTSIEKNQQWIRWSKPIHPPETQTFVLRYRVIGGGLDIRDSGDRLHWHAIFKHHAVPINQAKIIVTLPPSLAGQILSFQGENGQKINDRTVEFVRNQPLPVGEGVEVEVTFKHGILKVNNSVQNWLNKFTK